MILNTPDFNLEATLESGQVFGFEKKQNGLYEGTIFGMPVQVRQRGQVLEIHQYRHCETASQIWSKQSQIGIASGTSPDQPSGTGGRSGRPPLKQPACPRNDVRDQYSGMTEDEIIHFFHLDFDLSPIYELLSEDSRLNLISQKLKGLRIIRQNFWEALACFIISANNNIKRIQKIRRSLVAEFSKSTFQFPGFHEIARSSEEKLRALGLGYRAPFLLKTAKIISENPKILNDIRNQSYEEAKTKLLEFPGVGGKVADCVLLFGIQKYEAFPVDTWIARAMRKLYFRNREITEDKIQRFGQNRWKQYAGYIQQYLFHGTKSGIL